MGDLVSFMDSKKKMMIPHTCINISIKELMQNLTKEEGINKIMKNGKRRNKMCIELQ